jgi:RNA polymerase sigma-70 factor (ECF subfamily)
MLPTPDAHADVPPAELEARSRAFEAEILRWLPDVARFALSLTRAQADADDLVQETYLRAFRSWRTYRPDADARRWLFTICRNAFLRTREREERAVVIESDPELETLASVMLHVTAQRSGIDDLFDRLDVGPAIARAVSALPDAYRLAVVLVDVEGYDYADAAAVLGVPVGTVRSRLYRGRRLLQEALLAHARDAGLAGARGTSAHASWPTHD